MSGIFSLSENSSYNLRCGVTVNRQSIRTSKFGFETGITIRVILWNDLPAELKNGDILKFVKQKIKNLGYIYFQKPKKKCSFTKF